MTSYEPEDFHKILDPKEMEKAKETALIKKERLALASRSCSNETSDAEKIIAARKRTEIDDLEVLFDPDFKEKPYE